MKEENAKNIDLIVSLLELNNPILASTKMTKYATQKLSEVGCEDVPCNEIYSADEISALLRSDISKSELVFNALCIGFANGIKYGKN